MVRSRTETEIFCEAGGGQTGQHVQLDTGGSVHIKLKNCDILLGTAQTTETALIYNGNLGI